MSGSCQDFPPGMSPLDIHYCYKAVLECRFVALYNSNDGADLPQTRNSLVKAHSFHFSLPDDQSDSSPQLSSFD